MYSMTGLSVIGSFLLVGQVFFCSLLLTWHWAVGSLAQRSSQAGTLTGLLLRILRDVISLLLLYQLLLTLSDIPYFFYGVQKLREISLDGSNLGDSGILWRSTVPLLS
jgi:hypothetical protein